MNCNSEKLKSLAKRLNVPEGFIYEWDYPNEDEDEIHKILHNPEKKKEFLRDCFERRLFDSIYDKIRVTYNNEFLIIELEDGNERNTLVGNPSPENQKDRR